MDNRWVALSELPAKVKGLIADNGRNAVRGVIDAIYPAQMLDRDPHDPVNYAAPNEAMMLGGLSADTWGQIRFLSDEGCDMCARPLAGGIYLGAGGRCEGCTLKPFPFTRTRAACLYGEASKSLILPFKHADRTDMAPMFTQWIGRAAAELIADCDIIVPVPLHWSRLWSRRYNQAAEIARPLARQYDKDYLADGLRRVRPTIRQGSKVERERNLKAAFMVTLAGARRLRGRHVVLVDDVFTTGATVRACSKVLIAAGVRQIDVAVIARAASEADAGL
ncbi:ComF family protein [Asticcacaulis machinosus]|uniref:ComF family protein n=1 Tax=Asticcacaulis machinosus TaxID=2984211 RepID=A0ABT5HIC0_9CAUL|nr:ComF family protein [Asticcacaulis machinosus]MDC7675994.1 ComF family protein [Asticcacaulis machinosus]